MKELTIYGTIGEEVKDKDFIQLLKQTTGDIRINMNSKGGGVFEGYAIYNAIKEYNRGNVHIHIDGLAASMASLICLAADKIIMAENALYMIHNPRIGSYGDRNTLQKNLELLDKIKNIMIDTYHNKTQLSKDELSKMMDNEVWLSASEALKKGFVDEIKQNVLQAFSSNNFNTMPQTYNHSASWSLDDWMNKDPKGLDELAYKDPVAFKRLNDEYFSGVEQNTTSYSQVSTEYVTASQTSLRASWSLDDWKDKDPKGLNELAYKDPVTFKRLNDEYYN